MARADLMVIPITDLIDSAARRKVDAPPVILTRVGGYRFTNAAINANKLWFVAALRSPYLPNFILLRAWGRVGARLQTWVGASEIEAEVNVELSRLIGQKSSEGYATIAWRDYAEWLDVLDQLRVDWLRGVAPTPAPVVPFTREQARRIMPIPEIDQREPRLKLGRDPRGLGIRVDTSQLMTAIGQAGQAIAQAERARISKPPAPPSVPDPDAPRRPRDLIDLPATSPPSTREGHGRARRL